MAARHAELEKLISDPEIIQDRSRYVDLVKEHGELGRFTSKYRLLQEQQSRIDEANAILQGRHEDQELAELAGEELAEAEESKRNLFEGILDLWLEDDSEDRRNVIMEIRAGTGGDEAALFAGDLFRMYQHYAEKQNWKTDIIDITVTDLKGLKEVSFSISGEEAYRKLRYESGGHRVQRVPVTESQGRIHTSLATVAVMPEVKDVSVEINKEDLEVQRIRSQGPGGQKVNKTSSCVRIIHKPTGIMVRCQDEKSQFRNLDRAMQILAAKLFARKEAAHQESRDSLRRSQVGSGDRNERVRTYNFPQDRVTDHRIGLDLFGIEKILMGEIDGLLDALAEYDKQARLKAFAMENDS